MKNITLSLALCLCFAAFSTHTVSAQTQATVSVNKSIFDKIASFPKNLFTKLFISKNIQAPSPMQPTAGAVSSLSSSTKKIPDSKKPDTERKMESSVKIEARSPATPVSAPPISVVPPKPHAVADPSKKVSLKITVASGGNVFSSGKDFSCYSNDSCTKTVTQGSQIKLQAIPVAGYTFLGWSEPSCGKEQWCTFTLSGDVAVNASFEVTKKEKAVGKILYPRDGDTCYIPMGEDKCQVAFIWQSSSGLDMTVKSDDDEYYISISDESQLPKTLEASPGDLVKATKENADGLVYFPFFAGKHSLTMLTHTQIIDKVNFQVSCAPGLSWDGTKCWEKGGKILEVFKSEHVIITSDPAGIACGYRPNICRLGFSGGTRVTLKATVSGGVFGGWTGACSNRELTCTVIMDDNKSVGVIIK